MSCSKLLRSFLLINIYKRQLFTIRGEKMANAQFNPKLVNILKDILLRLHDGKPQETVKEDFDKHLNQVSAVEILLIVQELKNGGHGITSDDVVKLFSIYKQLYGLAINEWHVPDSNHEGHPVQILIAENKEFQSILDQMNGQIELLEKSSQWVQEEEVIEKLKEDVSQLGQLNRHYNRKEKLIFPILERYGQITPTRIMWEGDDRIRILYKNVKRKIENIQAIEIASVKQSYQIFQSKMTDMMFDEESILLPIVLNIFNEDDWLAIAREGDTFGYCFIDPQKEWERSVSVEDECNKEIDNATTKHIKIGGGYLTVQEANSILNNLPVEITFIDKNGIFKYFNERVASSDMMFVRTPISIGRNVANCHPPKSLKKVMRLVQDLKSKKRSSESMWFKKKDQYIHITYKGVFDEDGEYLGILEYVQDIRPFFELPREAKR